MQTKLFTTEQILPAQISDWNAKFGKIIPIEVATTDEPLTREVNIPEEERVPDGPTTRTEEYYEYITGYFRKPTMEEMGIAAQGNEANKVKITTILYNTCLLGGHPDFEKNQEVITAAMMQMKAITKTRANRLGKL